MVVLVKAGLLVNDPLAPRVLTMALTNPPRQSKVTKLDARQYVRKLLLVTGQTATLLFPHPKAPGGQRDEIHPRMKWLTSRWLFLFNS